MDKLKFLVDECLGLSISNWLKKNNYDVVSVLEVMPSSKDIAILKKAFDENRILITNDTDFGEMVFNKMLQHTGIILFRLHQDFPKKRINALANLIQKPFQ